MYYVNELLDPVNYVCTLQTGAMSVERRNSMKITSTKHEVEKFIGLNNLGLR